MSRSSWFPKAALCSYMLSCYVRCGRDGFLRVARRSRAKTSLGHSSIQLKRATAPCCIITTLDRVCDALSRTIGIVQTAFERPHQGLRGLERSVVNNVLDLFTWTLVRCRGRGTNSAVYLIHELNEADVIVSQVVRPGSRLGQRPKSTQSSSLHVPMDVNLRQKKTMSLPSLSSQLQVVNPIRPASCQDHLFIWH